MAHRERCRKAVEAKRKTATQGLRTDAGSQARKLKNNDSALLL
jgi:hypothetical protein